MVLMVGIAQLVEHLVVVQEVAGSSPVTHPNIDHSLVVPRFRQRATKVTLSIGTIEVPLLRLTAEARKQRLESRGSC